MKQTVWEIVRQVVMTLVGCAMMGAAFAFLTYPNSIVSGGLTGAGQIINLLTGLPVGVMVIVMNIPLFIVAWKKFGLRFILFSALGMVASSVFIDIFNALDYSLTDDILLASVYGGLLKGAGAGLVYIAGATTGGTDIGARMLRRRYPYVNFGNFSLALDAVVVVAFAVIFNRFDSAMYTVITMFVASRVVNMMLYGMDNASVCYIITLYPEKIADEIGRQLGRGSTLLQGEGAYSGEERDVVLCVVKRQQIPAVKKIVSAMDPRAFVIVTESHQVFGKNFSNIQKSD
ncbi:MAG: YitT family protein [Oscillospiraceae bacterium]|nr:YitT family protein [Oscillospiraceae bacterium]